MCMNGCLIIIFIWTFWSPTTNCEGGFDLTDAFPDEYEYPVDDLPHGGFYVDFKEVAPEPNPDAFPGEYEYPVDDLPHGGFYVDFKEEYASENPEIRVGKWMDSDDDFMVVCHHNLHHVGKFSLRVDTATEQTTFDPDLTTEEGVIFNVNVTLPVTFTCVLNIVHGVLNISSQNYTVSQIGSELEMPSVSFSYKVFSGSIGVILIAMTLVVITMTFRGKQIGDSRARQNNRNQQI